MTDHGIRRRSVLGALAGVSTASLAGCPSPGSDGDGEPSPNGAGGGNATATVDDDTARRLAERFAPTLYFDAAEPWLPTDPRPYTSERNAETVVNGFDALDGYTRRAGATDGPPDPTVFYHAVEYEGSPLAVVQFWFYSAFDQFTTNFHWHDWEVLHVFVDTDTDDPQLFVASAHSGRVPNNEHLNPGPDAVPRVLSELGSHSSALSLNDRQDSFQRFPLGDLPADITNRAIDAVGALADLPAAYGLPRDENLRLPYVVPELDGAPIYDHERLPAVDRGTLLPASLTIRSFDALSSPPVDLPERETGVRFDSVERAGPKTDVPYELVPTSEVTHIDGFTGPQLSFEFAVPSFAEDAIAGHISTAGTPWTQERYTNPAADITDPAHRATLAERYDAVAPPGPVADLVATVSEVIPSSDAPEDAGVETTAPSVEAVALLRSDPVAAPTFRGVAMFRGVDSGSHRLTVNGAGLAPHEERVDVDTTADDGSDDAATATPTPTPTTTADGDDTAGHGPTLAGVEGEIPLVAAEDALEVEVDADGVEAELTGLAVEDDFAGRLYEAPMDGPDAVYVHRGGAYTTEVRDADDALGAFRVNPNDRSSVRIDRPRTGKASLASYVSTVADETAARLASEARDDTDDTDDDMPFSPPGSGGSDGDHGGRVRGLIRSIEAVGDAAGRAAARAERNDAPGADRALEALRANLARAVERLDEARGDLPEREAAAADRRLAQAQRRAEQAVAAGKL